VAFDFSVPVDTEPLVASLPDQAPEAIQEFALVETHASVELPPLVTVLGLEVKLTVGAGEVRETVAACAALPPAPTHVIV